MTKEEILLEREPGDDASIYTNKEIFIAMDQYAKQCEYESIQWLIDNCPNQVMVKNPTGNWLVYAKGIHTEYLKSKETNNG